MTIAREKINHVNVENVVELKLNINSGRAFLAQTTREMNRGSSYKATGVFFRSTHKLVDGDA